MALDEKDLKAGVLGLLVALAEIIKDTLRLEAVRRMEAGNLTEEEVNRLGEALLALDAAIEKVKEDLSIGDAVQSVRDGLDRAVNEVFATMVTPWEGMKAPPAGS
ncbi:MAG: gas vesicle protein K [Chloroflexi bacterium]|nr:gas vesicle protein K [Chloroflexota bacterium]